MKLPKKITDHQLVLGALVIAVVALLVCSIRHLI
jgi:hypothetical protein